MDINAKIMKLCNERNWSTYVLAQEAGLTQSTLSSMLQRNAPPKIETLQCICEAFGITLSQFFIEDESFEALSKNEKEVIRLFRQLSQDKQDALIKLLDT